MNPFDLSNQNQFNNGGIQRDFPTAPVSLTPFSFVDSQGLVGTTNEKYLIHKAALYILNSDQSEQIERFSLSMFTQLSEQGFRVAVTNEMISCFKDEYKTQYCTSAFRNDTDLVGAFYKYFEHLQLYPGYYAADLYLQQLTCMSQKIFEIFYNYRDWVRDGYVSKFTFWWFMMAIPYISTMVDVNNEVILSNALIAQQQQQQQGIEEGGGNDDDDIQDPPEDGFINNNF